MDNKDMSRNGGYDRYGNTTNINNQLNREDKGKRNMVSNSMDVILPYNHTNRQESNSYRYGNDGNYPQKERYPQINSNRFLNRQ